MVINRFELLIVLIQQTRAASCELEAASQISLTGPHCNFGEPRKAKGLDSAKSSFLLCLKACGVQDLKRVHAAGFHLYY